MHQQHENAAQHDGDDRAQRTGYEYLTAEGALIVSAVHLAEQDRNAHAESRQHEDEQIHHRTRDAYGRKRIRAEESADDQRIDRIVQLLQYVADQQRHRKAQYVAAAVAL